MYKNILINQLNNIGDVLLTIPAIALLRKVYPQAKITLMVVARVAPLFENHPLIDEVLVFDYKNKKCKKWQIFRYICAQKYDLNISLDFRLRPLALVMASGIAKRITGEGLYQYKAQWYRGFFTERYDITGQYQTDHQVETFGKIMRGFLKLAPEVQLGKPTLAAPTQQALLKAAQLMPGEKKKVLFCIRGTHPEKNWEREKFAQVIQELQKQQALDCYLIGTPADYEYAQGLVYRLAPGSVVNLCGSTKLTELTALFERADLLITVDTGAAHIAATTNIPIISIFLCTNPVQWRPLSEKAQVLCYDWAFERFGLEKARLEKYFTVKPEITAADVLTAIQANNF